MKILNIKLLKYAEADNDELIIEWIIDPDNGTVEAGFPKGQKLGKKCHGLIDTINPGAGSFENNEDFNEEEQRPSRPIKQRVAPQRSRLGN